MIARVAVSTKGLVKRYGKRWALDGFTLDVPTGCVMGLVGPNGAGKTTWMMSVAGLLRAESGTIGLFGTSQPFDAALHSGRLAILPQDSELPLESTPESFLTGLARLQGLSKDAAKESVAKILESVNLADLERLCTHVTFVRDGKVVKSASLKDLTADGASLEDVYLGGLAK